MCSRHYYLKLKKSRLKNTCWNCAYGRRDLERLGPTCSRWIERNGPFCRRYPCATQLHPGGRQSLQRSPRSRSSKVAVAASNPSPRRWDLVSCGRLSFGSGASEHRCGKKRLICFQYRCCRLRFLSQNGFLWTSGWSPRTASSDACFGFNYLRECKGTFLTVSAVDT